ncbi:MAG: hypothetical protein K2F79_03240, partial [Muribaculaceae bacterium]|nr:hypothetical protein [Muribaculaceae bacterium]
QGTMYVENGKVTRALDTFDPDATDLRIDPEALARFILASALNDDFRPEAFLASFACPSDGFGFSLTNGNDEPIYINIVKASRKAEGGYDISPLGQPVGSYVLLPGQTIARSQPQIPESYEKHILIATHYFCAIDDLVESLRKAAADPGTEGAPVPALPVFIAHIR